MVNETAVKQGCTTYFTDSARNISGREVGGHSGGLGAVPPVGSRGKDPGQEVELMTIY